MSDTALTKDDIRAVLNDVIDPEVGISVVELGLIYEVNVDDGGCMLVKMTMTTPACPMSALLTDNVKEALLHKLPQIKDVKVELVWDPPWGPDMMSDEAKRELGWPDS
jgi:metal-sulfur cluster biosynthetic enzyme